MYVEAHNQERKEKGSAFTENNAWLVQAIQVFSSILFIQQFTKRLFWSLAGNRRGHLSKK
jgi:hypothetical protein